MEWASLSRLEKLPLPLLQSICGYLAHCTPKRRSLFDFSLVSRICSSATDIERFHHVHINVRTPDQLRHNVQQWKEILDLQYRFRHVRILKISGLMNPFATSQEEDKNENKSARCISDMGDWDAEDLDLFSPPKKHFPVYFSAVPHTEEETRSRHEEAWLPLAQLCRMFPALCGVVYACENRMSRCLLSAIHEKHLESHLHIHSFSLRSLRHSTRDPAPPIDPDELALATSPCLFSLCVSVDPYMGPAQVDYHDEAVLCMVQGLAPKLRGVQYWRPYMSIDRWVPPPRPQWQGFPLCDAASARNESRKGQLQSLFLGGSGVIGSVDIVKWSNHSDFRALRSLEIQCPLMPDGLRQLTQLASHGLFINLNSLRIVIDDRITDSGLEPTLVDLLRSIRPLQSLELTGSPVREAPVDAVLQHHASEILKLKLRPNPASFDFFLGRAEEFSQKLLQLNQLEICVPRLQGREQEVVVYRSLGRLPRLERLKLMLDCSIAVAQNLEDVNEEDEEYEEEDDDNGTIYINGFGTLSHALMQDAFINAALDSTLALDIFKILSSRNTSLRAVKLQPWGWQRGSPFGMVMEWIGRRWLIQRDTLGEVTLREMNEENRMIELGQIFANGERCTLGTETKMCKAVWGALWPKRSQCWWNDWSSFPLALDSN